MNQTSTADPQPGQVWAKAGPSDAFKIIMVQFDDNRLPGVSVRISYINSKYKQAWRRKTFFLPISREDFHARMQASGRSLLPNDQDQRRV